MIVGMISQMISMYIPSCDGGLCRGGELTVVLDCKCPTPPLLHFSVDAAPGNVKLRLALAQDLKSFAEACQFT